MDLAMVKQEQGETLRQYMWRFFDKRTTVVDVTDKEVIDLFQDGLYHCSTFEDFGRRRPSSITKLKDMITSWADEEDKVNAKYDSIDGVDAYQVSFGLASVQVHRRSQGTLLPLNVNPKCRIRGTMCNARSNLISEKALILERGYASNLLDHQDSSSLLHTGGSKRKRGENQSRDWIGSFVEVPR
jgi:hypothetical protein